jgi:hypothetical protein
LTKRALSSVAPRSPEVVISTTSTSSPAANEPLGRAARIWQADEQMGGPLRSTPAPTPLPCPPVPCPPDGRPAA